MSDQFIRGFQGDYRWLSSFWMSEFIHEEKLWASVEHYYQASKATNQADADMVRQLSRPGKAKRAGRAIKVRADWDIIKDEIMLRGVRAKFQQNQGLADKLLATGDAELIEENQWGDVYYGTCQGYGENRLGKILMRVREELKESQWKELR